MLPVNAPAIPELRGVALTTLHVNPIFEQLDGPPDLVARAKSLAQLALAERTVKGYAGCARRFITWCGAYNICAVPVTIEDLLLYLAFRSQRVKFGTVKQDLTAIRYLQTRFGFPMPQDVRIDDLMAGFARLSEPPMPKYPLRVADVRMVCDMLDRCPNEVQAIRDRAMFLTAVFTVFRGNELCGFQLVNVRFEARGVELRLPRSKRNQTGPPESIYLAYGDPQICPVRALLGWIRLLPDDTGPLFRRVWSNGRIGTKRLHLNTWTTIVKRAVTLLGYDPTEYASHSLRSGGLVSEYEAGSSTLELMRMGRYESERSLLPYLKYARPCPRLSVL